MPKARVKGSNLGWQSKEQLGSVKASVDVSCDPIKGSGMKASVLPREICGGFVGIRSPPLLGLAPLLFDFAAPQFGLAPPLLLAAYCLEFC